MENIQIQPPTFTMPVKGNVTLAKAVITTSLLSLLCLAILHIVSPEFDPSWRMVSEYALGNHQWALTLFFLFWGTSSCCLAIALRKNVTSKAGKAGVLFLFVSGIGTALASLFDVEHSLHGLAATLGVPTFIIAALLISYHLVKKENWKKHKATLLRSTHSTWLSLVLMIITMMVMMMGFQEAGIEFKEGSEPPKSVPEGVIALAGYANRILIVAYLLWLLIVAKGMIKNAK
jgi:hypothetical membrane protein